MNLNSVRSVSVLRREGALEYIYNEHWKLDYLIQEFAVTWLTVLILNKTVFSKAMFRFYLLINGACLQNFEKVLFHLELWISCFRHLSFQKKTASLMSNNVKNKIDTRSRLPLKTKLQFTVINRVFPKSWDIRFLYFKFIFVYNIWPRACLKFILFSNTLSAETACFWCKIVAAKRNKKS